MSDKTEDLFDQLKQEMIEYCKGNSDASLESEIQYYIKYYKKYNQRIKRQNDRL